MTLTITQLELMLKHRAGRAIPPELGVYSIINQVGEFVTSLEPWQWRNGPETFLDLVASQSWVSLPDDFGELRSDGIVAAASAPIAAFVLTDDSYVGHYSQQFTEPTATTVLYGAITYTSTDDDGPERRPIISIAPTPPVAVTGALRLNYRTRWNVVTTSVKHVDIPRFMEPLFIELCHAYYAGHSEHDSGDVSVRLENVLHTPNGEDTVLYAAAKRADGAVQGSFGRVTGGLVQMIRRTRRIDDDHPFPPLVTYP